MRRLLAFASCVICLSTVVATQLRTLEPPARIRITLGHDTRIVGGLAGSDDVSIFVTPDRGSLVKIPRTSIAKVETSAGHKSRARGALIGFAAGAAGGALAGSSAPCTSFCGGTFGSAGLIVGAILGAGAGAAIGAVVPPGERWTAVPVSVLPR